MRSFFPFVALQNVRPGLRSPGVDAEEGQRPDVRVGHDLERQRGERRLVVGGRDLFGLVSGFTPVDRGTSSGEGR